MLSPLLPVLATEFNVPVAKMGTVVTAYAFAASVCALIVGPLSDRWGRVIFLRAAILLLGLTGLLAFAATRFEVYLAARLLAGLAGGTISACVLAQMADMFTFQRRGRAMGWIGAIYSFAAIFGVPIAAWIAGRWSWRIVYLIIASAALPFVLFMRTRSTPQTSSASLPFARQTLIGYLRYWKVTATRNGLLLAGAISATAAALLTYLGAYLTASFRMKLAEVGWIFFAAGVASTLGALLGGRISDRLSKRSMVALTSLTLAVILPVFTQAQNLFLLYVIVSALGGLLAAREGPYQALISELAAPAAQRGAYIAMRNATSQVAIAASVAFGGWLFSRHGFGAMTYYAATLSLAAAGLVWLLKEPDGREPAHVD